MPVYEFLCTNCNNVFEVIGSYNQVGQEQNCRNCNYICKKIPSRVSMQPDNFWNGQYAPNVGKWFTSKTQYQNYLREKGKIIVEKGMKTLTDQERAKVVVDKNEKTRKEIIADVIKNGVPSDNNTDNQNNIVNFINSQGQVL